MWLDGWSYLSENGLVPSADVKPTLSNTIASSITTNVTLNAETTYYMTQQVFVKAPAILTIEAGTTIKSYRQDANGKAPTLVIEQGAKIIAEGTKALPITFTSVLPASLLPIRGAWGRSRPIRVSYANSNYSEVLLFLEEHQSPPALLASPTISR
eukprot:1336344-Amorphochlora_amoeboformis.AAC.1